MMCFHIINNIGLTINRFIIRHYNINMNNTTNISNVSQIGNTLFKDLSSHDNLIISQERCKVNPSFKPIPTSFNDGDVSFSKELKERENMGHCVCTYPGCERTFTAASYLKTHLFTHTQSKPNQCPYCKNSYSQKRRLESHILIHVFY